MATLKPDPTFYPSPRLAAEAPREALAYVVTLNASANGNGRPDALTVIDLNPESTTMAARSTGSRRPTSATSLFWASVVAATRQPAWTRSDSSRVRSQYRRVSAVRAATSVRVQSVMSDDQIDKLASAFADATGITFDEARIALEDQDDTMIRMARGVVELHETEDEWHADMARRRRKILEAA